MDNRDRAAEQFVRLVTATRDSAPSSQPGSGLDPVIGAVASLAVADIVTITEKLPSGAMVVVASTDQHAAPLGDVYDDSDPSPCTSAAATDEIQHSTDLACDGRWPTWTRETLDHGIRAVISLQLHRQAGPLGCLNLYWREPHEITSDELDVARLAAIHVSIELAHHRSGTDLWRAIDARHLIGQAQGLLMAQYGIDAAQAFAVLRRMSQHSNTKLHVVAEQVVEDRGLDLDRSRVPQPQPQPTV